MLTLLKSIFDDSNKVSLKPLRQLKIFEIDKLCDQLRTVDARYRIGNRKTDNIKIVENVTGSNALFKPCDRRTCIKIPNIDGGKYHWINSVDAHQIVVKIKPDEYEIFFCDATYYRLKYFKKESRWRCEINYRTGQNPKIIKLLDTEIATFDNYMHVCSLIEARHVYCMSKLLFLDKGIPVDISVYIHTLTW